MPQNYGSNRARQEQLARRRQFYAGLQKSGTHKTGNVRSSDYESGGLFNLDYNEWRVRRVAPFALLIYIFTILFTIGWIFTSGTSLVSNTHFSIEEGQIGVFEIPEGKAIYQFQVEQRFPIGATPLYSELEMEIVDENYGHVYSFYKDLWQEQYPNDDGIPTVYNDVKMEFEIELPKAGVYYIRAIPYNDNEGDVSVVIFKRKAGSIYFPYYTFGFLGISLILLFGGSVWGMPSDMVKAMRKSRSIRKNKLLIAFFVLLLTTFVGSIYVSATNYGYARAGDEVHLPTWFYRTNNVNYLG